MDLVQQQIVDLSQKVDQTNQAIEKLYRIVNEVLLEVQDMKNYQSSQSERETSVDIALGAMSRSFRLDGTGLRGKHSLQHKDVLEDDEHLEADFSNSESNLAPDMQIRRLTAQLTAAYNRIAALEEQLLSRRISPNANV